MPIKRIFHHKFFYVLLLVHAFAFTDVHSQEPVHRLYDSRHGLPSSEIYHAIQDQEGYIWFASDHGLVRFDGYRFHSFGLQEGLPENSVFSFSTDPHGRIWFSTFTGQFGFLDNGKPVSYKFNDQIQTFLTDEKKFSFRQNSFEIDTVGRLYFECKEFGIFVADTNGSITAIDTTGWHQSLNVLIIDKQRMIISRDLWRPLNQIQLIEGETKQIIPFNPPLEPANGLILSDIKRTPSGILYISTQQYMLKINNGAIIQTVRLPSNIVGFDINSQENIVVCTFSDGVFMYNESLQVIEHCFQDKAVTSFLEDHEGGYWFTLLDNGLLYVPEPTYLQFDQHIGLPRERIINLRSDKSGKLRYCTRSGFYGMIWNNELYAGRIHIPKEGIIQEMLYDFRRDRIWFATTTGLFYISTKSDNQIPIVQEFQHETFTQRPIIKKMLLDPITGDIWNGHRSGLSCLSSTYSSDLEPHFIAEFDEFIEAMEFSKEGDLWIGTTNGLYKYTHKGFEFYGEMYPGLKQRITALKQIGDTLWIGTRGNGLLGITNGNIFNLTSNDGLISNSISTIVASEEHIFIGTNKGLNILKRRSDIPGVFPILHYTVSGITNLEITAMEMADNKLFIASPGKIIVIKDSFHLSNQKNIIRITNVSLAGKQIPITSYPVVDHSNNEAIFSYFAISYKFSGPHTYKHRLVGLSNEWTINQQTTVQYPYLPSGNYTFEVEVLNPDGSWTAAAEKFQFRILKPYWKKTWFIALFISISLMIIIGISLLLYRGRIRRKQLVTNLHLYQQEALTNQMNPHFLFNALNTVQRYILENDKVSSSRYLTKFSNLMRTTLNNLQEQLISIEKEIASLEVYLDLESARFKDRFTYHLNYSPEINPAETYIPVFLIQPLVENAIWHGLMESPNYGKIEVSFIKSKNDLICQVSDNGIGREAAIKIKAQTGRESLGLSIIQKRLALISISTHTKSELVFEDLYDETGKASGTISKIIFRQYFNKTFDTWTPLKL